jgi:hypothetical protein
MDLTEASTRPEIKSRFKELVKSEHPDKRRDDPRAAEKFARILEAYQLVQNREASKGEKEQVINDLWEAIDDLDGVEVWDLEKVKDFDGFTNLGVDMDDDSTEAQQVERGMAGTTNEDGFQVGGAAASSDPFRSTPGSVFESVRTPDPVRPASRVQRSTYRIPRLQRTRPERMRPTAKDPRELLSLGLLAGMLVWTTMNTALLVCGPGEGADKAPAFCSTIKTSLRAGGEAVGDR